MLVVVVKTAICSQRGVRRRFLNHFAACTNSVARRRVEACNNATADVKRMQIFLEDEIGAAFCRICSTLPNMRKRNSRVKKEGVRFRCPLPQLFADR